jgi:hypothetical protein
MKHIGRGQNKAGEHIYEGSQMDAEELAFAKWMDDWTRRTGRRFPSWRQILAEAKRMGYRIAAKVE